MHCSAYTITSHVIHSLMSRMQSYTFDNVSYLAICALTPGYRNFIGIIEYVTPMTIISKDESMWMREVTVRDNLSVIDNKVVRICTGERTTLINLCTTRMIVVRLANVIRLPDGQLKARTVTISRLIVLNKSSLGLIQVEPPRPKFNEDKIYQLQTIYNSILNSDPLQTLMLIIYTILILKNLFYTFITTK